MAEIKQTKKQQEEINKAWKDWGRDPDNLKKSKGKKKKRIDWTYYTSSEEMRNKFNKRLEWTKYNKSKQQYQDLRAANPNKVITEKVKRTPIIWDYRQEQSLERTMFDTTATEGTGQIATAEAIDSGYYIDPFDEEKERIYMRLFDQAYDQAIEHKQDVKTFMKLLDKKRYILPGLYDRCGLDQDKPLKDQQPEKIVKLANMLNQYNKAVRKQGQKWLRDVKLEDYLNNCSPEVGYLSRLIIADPNGIVDKRTALIMYLNEHYYWGDTEQRDTFNVVPDDVVPVKDLLRDFKTWCKIKGYQHGAKMSQGQLENILCVKNGCGRQNLGDWKDHDYQYNGQSLGHKEKELRVYTKLTPRESGEINLMYYKLQRK
ncbi:hypothetical protein [Ligilactobacillus acidipiscis]|uniref:hypothetical protein n=1 Tax=Ligilactobacillus acidipiscis TaxID=89059 RepID=UPI0023F6852C|nr:hypothetical protein [Ligilactobacillus acidipiscis]WEV57842.1 hypothetical protein OZX66_04705 [Ligilactobacillus acidipiscis]